MTSIQEDKKVSVVIPTIGRIETLPAVITAVEFQTYNMIDEIIILDEAACPISESYPVNQALDVLSVSGIDVKILRNRKRKGIGAARLLLAKEARNELILMIDDDVVLYPRCLEILVESLGLEYPWAVPHCFLVPKALELDGYIDWKVDPDNPEVLKWTQKYPWFIPYFRYSTRVITQLEIAGTQSILIRKTRFLNSCSRLPELGNLPREDTYMTKKMGLGVFDSYAECLHYEHPSQVDRGNWGSSMFYRLHEAIKRDPDAFLGFIRKFDSSEKRNG